MVSKIYLYNICTHYKGFWEPISRTTSLSKFTNMASPAKTLVVAGGGIIGLSVARAAARAGLQVVLLEKNVRVGMETSARNSEVLHGALRF